MSAPQLSPEQREAFAQALYAGRKIEAIRQLQCISMEGNNEKKDLTKFNLYAQFVGAPVWHQFCHQCPEA